MLRAGFLFGAAKELVEELRARRPFLEIELAELNKRKREVEAQLAAVPDADARYAKFESEIDGNLQCPRCWIYNKRNAIVRPELNKGNKVFRCDDCGREFRESPV